MKFGFFTISTFDLIPLCSRIASRLCTLHSDNTVDMVQCQVANSVKYHERVRKISIGEYSSRKDVKQQSYWFKIVKYIKLTCRIILFQMKNRSSVLYTIDLPTLNILFLTCLVFFFNKNFLIYHQFEILEPADLNPYNRLNFIFFKWMKKGLDLFIAPEINRIEYFIKITGFPEEKTFLFANTTTVSTSPDDVDAYEADIVKIAHIGTVGDAHYVHQFMEVLNEFRGTHNFRVLFIGYLPEKVKNLIQSFDLPNVELIGDMPHYKLQEYYKKIDIGLILYKDLGINYKYCAPNKLYEYWANGIFVIAHQLDGLTPLFTNHELGKLCDMDNLSEFKNCLLSTVQNVNSFSKEQIIAIFKDKYSIEKYFNGFSQILKERFVN